MGNIANSPIQLNLLDSLQTDNLFKDQRYLLMNADTQGMMRHDLITTLGKERAKGFLLRYGWSCGYNDAKLIRNKFPNKSDIFLQEQGPIMHTIQGNADVKLLELELNLEENKFYMEGLWKDSYEAKQHIKHFGLSLDCVCWTLIGYAGGYSTGLFNRQILYKETSCVGRGDEICRFIGKTVEDWGDEISSELKYYDQSTISEELEDAYRKIQHQYQLHQHIMSVHEQLNRMALDGYHRKAIIKTIGEMLSSTVVVEDKDLNPIGWWLDPNLHLNIKDCLLGSVLNENPSLHSWLKRVNQARQAMDLTDQDEKVLPRTTAPIIIGGEVMGYLSVMHSDNSNEELRHMITERAATVIGIDLLKEKTKLETEHRLRGEFLEELLDHTTSIESLKSRARYMGHDLEAPHRFLLVGIDPPWVNVNTSAEQEEFLSIRKKVYNIVQNVANNLKQNVMVVERPKGILVLINTSEAEIKPYELAKTIMNLQQKQFNEISVSVSIGREADSIEELRKAFLDCRSNIEVMVRLGRVKEIFFEDEISMFDLLYANSSPEQLCSLAEKTLDKLLIYDQNYNGQYTETLHVFLMNECNLQRTIKSLNISLSGLKYRLQRLQDISGINLDDPNQRFNLQLALRILIANGKCSFTTTNLT